MANLFAHNSQITCTKMHKESETENSINTIHEDGDSDGDAHDSYRVYTYWMYVWMNDNGF